MPVMSGVIVLSFLDVATTWCIISGTLAKMESWNSVRLQKFGLSHLNQCLKLCTKSLHVAPSAPEPSMLSSV